MSSIVSITLFIAVGNRGGFCRCPACNTATVVKREAPSYLLRTNVHLPERGWARWRVGINCGSDIRELYYYTDDVCRKGCIFYEYLGNFLFGLLHACEKGWPMLAMYSFKNPLKLRQRCMRKVLTRNLQSCSRHTLNNL